MVTQDETGSESYKIKELITEAFSYKYFYLISLLLCFCTVYFINRFSPTVYEVSSIVGPVDDKRSSILGSNDLFSGLGAFSQSKNLENDLKSLSSFSLVTATLNNLNFEIGYFRENNKIFKQKQQIYHTSPFTVSIDKSHVQPVNFRFYIQILDNNSFRLTAFEDGVMLYNYLDNRIVSENNVLKVDTISKFNETINNKKFKFSVSLNQGFLPKKSKDEHLYYFEFYHLDYLTENYLKKLAVEPVSTKASLINVFFHGENLEMTVDFLNSYLQAYLDNNLFKKNQIAVNTINFIDLQISEISDSLVISESRLKDYRSANQVMDLSYQGQRAFEQMAKIESDRTNLQMQERYYNYILDLFNKNKDMAGIAPPSAANVTDPIMNQLIMDLVTLNKERSGILSNNTEKNLFLGQLDNKIKLQKQTIIENVTNNLNTLNLSLNELNYRADKLSKEISKLPRTELNMVSIQRKFTLGDAIYTFMLQKRSEAEITMASNHPDYEILEPAREITNTILSPKTMLNWLLAFFLGLMIPTVFIILKNFFNENFSSVYDVEKLLGKPVLGVIFNSSYQNDAVVFESPGSAISDSFRNLRSSLLVRFKANPFKVILITSSQPRDGKSFVSFNLASSIASVGYKTIILDCDLRRPTIHEKFRQENLTGLSNYMVNNTSRNGIIHNTFIKNLSFIPAGPILPNSSELIESGVLDELINDLKSKYDFIIIDSTPAGLVADATLMMKYSSVNLLVCRNNFTRKDFFADVLSLFKTNRIDNFEIVFNDVNLKKSRYGRYNNYYNKI